MRNAKRTIEGRIIKHLQEVKGINPDQDKLIIIKLKPGLTNTELSYLYSTARSLLDYYGCLVLFLDENVLSVNTENWVEFFEDMPTGEIEKLQELLTTAKAANLIGKLRKIPKKHMTFRFIDVHEDGITRD